MLESHREGLIWVEKYRPQKIKDCILPKHLKKIFQEIVDQNKLGNILLVGPAGVGKTTVARALCNQLECDVLMINGSKDGNIDTLRTIIQDFASTVSLSGGKKVVLLDEADYLNPTSTQPALRGFIEEFAGNCRFILTCNFANKILKPIHSRCSVIHFTIPKEEKPILAGELMLKIEGFLKKEDVKFNKKVLAEVIMKYFPDFRRVINEIQRYAASGTIDSGILVSLEDENVRKLISYLKNKDFRQMRVWVAENLDFDPSIVFRKIYDSLYDYVESESIPQAVLILADYQYKSAFVADQEVNMVACLVEIMVDVVFKRS